MLSHFSHVWLFVIPWTVPHQATLSMGFSRQEYWSGLPFPSPWDFPDPRMEPTSLMSLALTGKFFTTRATENMGVSSITQLRPAKPLTSMGNLSCHQEKRKKKSMETISEKDIMADILHKDFKTIVLKMLKELCNRIWKCEYMKAFWNWKLRLALVKVKRASQVAPVEKNSPNWERGVSRVYIVTLLI